MVFCQEDVDVDRADREDEVVVILPTDSDDAVVEDIDFKDEFRGFISPSDRDVVV